MFLRFFALLKVSFGGGKYKRDDRILTGGRTPAIPCMLKSKELDPGDSSARSFVKK